MVSFPGCIIFWMRLKIPQHRKFMLVCCLFFILQHIIMDSSPWNGTESVTQSPLDLWPYLLLPCGQLESRSRPTQWCPLVTGPARTSRLRRTWKYLGIFLYQEEWGPEWGCCSNIHQSWWPIKASENSVNIWGHLPTLPEVCAYRIPIHSDSPSMSSVLWTTVLNLAKCLGALASFQPSGTHTVERR